MWCARPPPPGARRPRGQTMYPTRRPGATVFENDDVKMTRGPGQLGQLPAAPRPRSGACRRGRPRGPPRHSSQTSRPGPGACPPTGSPRGVLEVRDRVQQPRDAPGRTPHGGRRRPCRRPRRGRHLHPVQAAAGGRGRRWAPRRPRGRRAQQGLQEEDERLQRPVRDEDLVRRRPVLGGEHLAQAGSRGRCRRRHPHAVLEGQRAHSAIRSLASASGRGLHGRDEIVVGTPASLENGPAQGRGREAR